MSALTQSLAANPGLAYPERALRRERWYETPARALAGRLARPFVGSSRRYAPIAAVAATYAESMRALTLAEIRMRAAALGRRLGVRGFEPLIVAESFALVREAAGRTLGQRHYDVQLIGAWALLHGKVAEMDTGEGKTLTATLAAATAALSGRPVHLITANDYLAERDAGEMAPLYEALGLTVGNPHHGRQPAERRAAYARDIVYCSNKEIAFDFLRDRITLGQRRRRLSVRLERLADQDSALHGLLLRGLCFAIVDEADSVLVDEARTPLIISAPGADGDPDGIYATAVALARQLDADAHFRVLAAERQVELTEPGRARLAALAGDAGGIWRGPRRRAQLVEQALGALHLFQRDVHYLVRDGKVQIIDEYTGRVLPDRAWEHGLHQMVESKEQVAVTAPRDALARTSYQHFFRRYLHLCGMTGTAREVAPELHQVYGLDVVRVPTHRPCRRRTLRTRVFARATDKWQAVAVRVAGLQAEGRPVLIGTRTVAASSQASAALYALGVRHRLLSASQDREEAEIVAEAGLPGRVTVATNMAGRGTDIKLGPDVAGRGGLQVLATELHDARRIDRQLFGRCARQGDPGAVQCFLSLEDELILTHLPATARTALRALLSLPGGTPLVRAALRHAQRRAERRNLATRRRLLKSDEQLEDALAFSGGGT